MECTSILDNDSACAGAWIDCIVDFPAAKLVQYSQNLGGIAVDYGLFSEVLCVPPDYSSVTKRVAWSQYLNSGFSTTWVHSS